MRGTGGILFVILIASNAWFYQAGGWNQNSRLDLVRAIVERGTLRIDAYHDNTGDKARTGDHFYSDKAPGLALAAVPVAVVARPALEAATVDEGGYVRWLSYFLTLAVAGLPAALTGVLLFAVARRLGASGEGAAVAALAFGLATPAWAYATLLFGHALATFCLFAAFAAGLAIEREATTARRDFILGLAVGVAAGWATITEYPSALPAVLLAGYALARAWHGGWPRRARAAAGVAAGALGALVVLLAYNLAAFGGPLETGYTYVVGFGGMKQGFMGVSTPKMEVLVEILFGSYRGLLFHAPVLAAALVGFPILLISPGRRAAGGLALAIVAYYVLFNAAYVYWIGGWSYGPRHMAPALPFLTLGLAPCWTRAGPPLRVAVAVLALFSVSLTLVAVSTTAQPPEAIRRPLAELQWPAFVDGDLSINHQSFLERGVDPSRLRGGTIAHEAFNLGELMGLRGRASLLPLLGLWALAGAAMWRRTALEDEQ